MEVDYAVRQVLQGNKHKKRMCTNELLVRVWKKMGVHVTLNVGSEIVDKGASAESILRARRRLKEVEDQTGQDKDQDDAWRRR